MNPSDAAAKAAWRAYVGAQAPDVWDVERDCAECGGSGSVMGVSKRAKRKPCKPCGATGKVPAMHPVLKHYWREKAAPHGLVVSARV